MMTTTKKQIADHRGFIRIWRKIWDNPLSRKPIYLSIFLYILSHANYEDKDIIWNNKKVKIKRGSYIGSISEIAEHFKISKGTVYYVLEYLKVERIVERRSTGKFTLFTVLNYDDYQKVERQSENKLNTNKTQIETTNNYNNNKNILLKKVIGEKTHGNEKVNFILKEFEERWGYPPTDKKPRFEAWNLTRRINSFIKAWGKEPTEKYFRRAVRMLFEKISREDWAENIQTIGTIRRKMPIYLKLPQGGEKND